MSRVALVSAWAQARSRKSIREPRVIPRGITPPPQPRPDPFVNLRSDIPAGGIGPPADLGEFFRRHPHRDPPVPRRSLARLLRRRHGVHSGFMLTARAWAVRNVPVVDSPVSADGMDALPRSSPSRRASKTRDKSLGPFPPSLSRRPRRRHWLSQSSSRFLPDPGTSPRPRSPRPQQASPAVRGNSAQQTPFL